MPQIIRPDSHTGITAEHERKLRRHAYVVAFDPNEDPVIIGLGASTDDGATPSNPASGYVTPIIIGASAFVSGDHDIAIGKSAQVIGADGSIAIGYTAVVNGVNGAVCIGQFSEVDSASGVAVGDSSFVSGPDGVALGCAASAEANSSVALGFGTVANIVGQICLGKDNRHFVEVRKYNATYGSVVVMQSPNGTRYALQVSNAGALSVIASPV